MLGILPSKANLVSSLGYGQAATEPKTALVMKPAEFKKKAKYA